MKSSKNCGLYTAILIMAVFFGSCKSTKLPVMAVPVEYREKVVERLVKVAAPADSLTVAALFECNDKNQVIMAQLDEEKSKRLESGFSFSDNKLIYKAQTKPDIIYLPAKDSIIYQEVPVTVNVPVEVNRVTWWQHLQIYMGRVLLLCLLMYGGYKLYSNVLLKKIIP